MSYLGKIRKSKVCIFFFFNFCRHKKRIEEERNTPCAKTKIKSSAKRKLESSSKEQINPNSDQKVKSCKVVLFRENFDDKRTTSNSKLKVKSGSKPKIVPSSKTKSDRTSISLQSSKKKTLAKQIKLSTKARNSKSASQKMEQFHLPNHQANSVCD